MYIRTHEGLGQVLTPSSDLPTRTDPFFKPNRELTPLPGQGARDPKFNRLAAKEEERERAAIEQQRGVRNGGTVVLLANDLARQARSWSDLQNLVRKHVFGSHIADNQQDAKLLINTAVNAYNKRYPGGDPFYIAFALEKEYDEKQLETRRQRVGQIAQQMERDPILRARLEWQERVNGLAEETGLDPQFVGEFLVAYDALSKPAFPGRIDPRGVPLIQLQLPLVVIAKILKELCPFAPPPAPVICTVISLYEAYTGKDLVTQQRLPTWQRGLSVVIAILPFVPKVAKGPITQGARGVMQVSKAALAAISHQAKQMAALAMELRVPARTILRFVGKLARLPLDKLRQLFQRIDAARKAGRALQLTNDEAVLARQVDDAFREFTPTAKAVPPVIKAATARAFMFLSREQPLFLGRLLGRLLSLTTPGNVKSGLQAAERSAADVVRRIRNHWDAAVSKVGGAAQTAQQVFVQLRAARPANPNTWVRDKLFDAWRPRAMRRIYNDRALVRDLKEQFGIIIGKNPKTGTITMHIRTKPLTAGGRVQTPLDFDHATIGHASAVAEALRTNDFRRLISTVDSSNLQLMTGRENRNFIEALRNAEKEMGVLVPPPVSRP